jgi:DNA polymerase/3'-5' exonuclease PolX
MTYMCCVQWHANSISLAAAQRTIFSLFEKEWVSTLAKLEQDGSARKLKKGRGLGKEKAERIHEAGREENSRCHRINSFAALSLSTFLNERDNGSVAI